MLFVPAAAAPDEWAAVNDGFASATRQSAERGRAEVAVAVLGLYGLGDIGVIR